MNKINYEKRYQMIGRLVDELTDKKFDIITSHFSNVIFEMETHSQIINIWSDKIEIFEIIHDWNFWGSNTISKVFEIKYNEKQWLNQVLAKVDELLNDENTPAEI